MNKTQLVVVGGGPGGYAAAFYAADLGMEVTLVELEKNPGGVCLYRGCIPSKALLHVAKLLDETQHSAAWGVEFAKPKIDLDKLREFKNGVVGKLTGGLGVLTKRRKINHVRGYATFKNAHTLTVEHEDGKTTEITFENAIIATGSKPARVGALWIDSPRMIRPDTATFVLDRCAGSSLVVQDACRLLRHG